MNLVLTLQHSILYNKVMENKRNRGWQNWQCPEIPLNKPASQPFLKFKSKG